MLRQIQHRLTVFTCQGTIRRRMPRQVPCVTFVITTIKRNQ
jgi:hypothetical protein